MVVMSNGFSRFHLSTAAAQLAKLDRLTLLITGPYPTPVVRRLLHLVQLDATSKGHRLLARTEAINDAKVRSLWIGEVFYALGRLFRSREQALVVRGMQVYGRAAGRSLADAYRRGARIYHYRAGFGGSSVAIARRLGMTVVCDHSIVHPRFVESLPAANGDLEAADVAAPLTPIEAHILRDIDAADQILVNSDFVRETFLRLGYAADRISVIYQGLDDAFARSIPARTGNPTGPLRLLAPAFNTRKGAPTLVAALEGLDDVDWTLTISREIDADCRERFADFLADPRVTVINPERSELPQVMAAHEVVLFPSYAEGSARVIFEALGAGLYVVTTPNAGSVVQDSVHGRLVAAGNAEALRTAVRQIVPIREQLKQIGEANRLFIRDRHNQNGYGAALASFYDRLERPEIEHPSLDFPNRGIR